MAADPSDNWKEIAAQKEKEWKEVTELRIQTLEAAYQEKDKQLQEEKAKFIKLKEDFKYNLKILEERDQELERYDVSFADLKSQLNAQTAEMSELKIRLDDAKAGTNREAKARDELHLHYQQRLKEKQNEIDSYRCNKDAEVNEERKEFEKFKRNLQQKINEVENDLDCQKRELTMNFEDALKQKEHEFRLQRDEMSAKVLEYELKSKLFAKELEIMKTAQEKNSEEYNYVEHKQRELEKQLKEKEWELSDTTAMTNAKISDLENQVQQSELAMKRMKEDFQRKHAEMDKFGREKEAALAKVKEGYAEREQSLQNTIRELQSKLEDGQVEIRKLQWAKADTEKEKEIQTEKLQEEITQLKEKWDKQIVDVSRSQVNKDIELQSLKENEEKLKADVMQKKQDIERYKKELNLAVERENSLERSKMQCELDWQRRFEDAERHQYGSSEDLIKKLTRSRDEALAVIKERDRDIQQRDSLIRALHRDRQQALATLKQHGIPVDKNINVDIGKAWTYADPEELDLLKQQNDGLKSVIKEMRKQMENLGQEIPSPDKYPTADQYPSSRDDFVQNMESEIKKLKQRNRKLENDLETYRKYGRAPLVETPRNEEEVMAEVKENTALSMHVKSLNEHIGALRSEKVDLSAQVKKQQARLQYLESSVDKLNKEPRQKQVEIDQLKYELNAQTRRDQAEIASLKQRLAELEVQLLEARKEADEYYKETLERNMEVTNLGQQISLLKMDLAERRPEMNFGAQELVIQQLQDEILHLKHGSGQGSTGEPIKGGPLDKDATVKELQQKLKAAAKHIAQLAKERQQLIEMGNRMRAEFKKSGINPPSGPPKGGKSHFIVSKDSDKQIVSQPLSQEFLNKLTQLERLQYELTKQQLQYTQKFPEQKISDKSNSDCEAEYRPPSILKKSSQTDNSKVYDMESSQELMDDTFRSNSPLRSSRERALLGMTPRDREKFLVSMSSAGGESLEEVWQMLDQPSPSPFATPRYPRGSEFQRSADSQSGSVSEILIRGKKPDLHERSKSETKVSSVKTTVEKKKPTRKSKIRNYNQRDDGFS